MKIFQNFPSCVPCQAACDRGRAFGVGQAILIAMGITSPVFGQQVASGNSAHEADTSGTNPAVLSKTLSFSNEYRFISDRYYDVADLRYTQPFFNGKAAARLTLPFVTTDTSGDTKSSFGDASLKLSWIPHVDARQAFVLSTEIYAPTANDDTFGTEKWVAAPGITWARFISRELIVAPALIYNFSFAGDDDRADVDRADVDIYVVYRPHGKRWWLTSDITISHDFESDVTPVSWELALGRNLGTLPGGGAINGYIRPGIGIGADRPYDANIEVGISLVNF
ncbi:hypothetical protein QCN27_15805 [Cereibacter sp. SYSU M97828]|nr:hypothetical protein [Cereibacter flavus]